MAVSSLSVYLSSEHMITLRELTYEIASLPLFTTELVNPVHDALQPFRIYQLCNILKKGVGGYIACMIYCLMERSVLTLLPGRILCNQFSKFKIL